MRAAVVLTVVVLGLAPAACAGSGPVAPPAGVVQGTGGPVVYVALGGRESSGDDLRRSWSQVLYRTAFPRRTVHVNVADEGSAVCCDLAEQVDRAIEIGATVATVWFGADDEDFGTPEENFGDDLETGVRRLRDEGVRVLLISGPDGRYTTDVATVAEGTDSDLVDLAAAGIRGRADQQGVADAVAEVLGPIR